MGLPKPSAAAMSPVSRSMPMPSENRDDDDVTDWSETDRPGHFIDGDSQEACLSNIMITADEVHPLYGKGLFAHVSVGDLPLPVDELAVFVNNLKAHDLTARQLSPFCGMVP